MVVGDLSLQTSANGSIQQDISVLINMSSVNLVSHPSFLVRESGSLFVVKGLVHIFFYASIVDDKYGDNY